MNKKLALRSLAAACACAPYIAYCHESRKICKSTCESPDYLMILGCTVVGTEPQSILRLRINDAAEFLKQNKTTVAIACGGICNERQKISEAEAIKNELMRLGIEEERIILEDKSQSTVENFINAKEILKNLGALKSKKLAYMTSSFHVLRSSFIAEACEMDITPLAAKAPKNSYHIALLYELLVLPLLFKEMKKKRSDMIG